ncbi:phosphoribosylaminoimidazolecarboxamide formyltransferase/IMP cyclohydrolase [Saccharopolyspora lacisalsi]|uniref:Bifunctional purine biosynthesis protein PurH n=1 Tax=Halosaccharopolyspora lacisalsi TaxID=1000566 RepID=A0A839DPR1_9PSEU|nr:phosphoribosylaminoimidazolecarboxamide formyltransferase/IMP cyclohydrolase [Halosaccharopolyspora lacisalsi]
MWHRFHPYPGVTLNTSTSSTHEQESTREIRPREPARVVVLVSGTGSLMRALLEATKDPDYPVRVVAVGADREGVEGLTHAENEGVPTFAHRLGDYASREEWDGALAESCAAYEPDLVVSAGFMKLVGERFLARFSGRYLNSHPALLPSFPGMHGVRDALDYGVRVTGCTLFVVDAGVDTGPILAQRAVEVRSDDDEHGLHERIKAVERRLLVETLQDLARHGWTVRGRKVSIGVTTNSQDRRPVRRVLIGVSDKAGLLEFATGLHAAGVEIVSTGGTARTISDAGVPVTSVDEVTGFPEALDGRVKTLHPRVHAGLLADTRREEHVEQLENLDIASFDLLVVNLYPFVRTVESGAGAEEIVENIDIGGPAMVRAAAKNHSNVGVVVDPVRYEWVLEQVRRGGFTQEERTELAAEAFRHTASYDVAVAEWMSRRTAPADETFPSWMGRTWQRRSALRYGENPHQPAALYVSGGEASGLAAAAQVHGKEMSYNNYVDADAAWRSAHDHANPCVAVIKHANPCGIAVSDQEQDIAVAHRKAHECDPVSAFGGVIAANREVSVAMAEQIAEVFTEVVVAPGYAEGAVDVLMRKKNVRILTAQPPRPGRVEMRAISGGLLVQGSDAIDATGDDVAEWTLAAGSPADDATLRDLEFAWRTCRAVKSNAILLADDGATVGVGMGQVNRVDSARLAVSRSGDRARGAVAASDAFFPFADGLQVLLDAGVRAVVQPGGSVRDGEVIAAAEAAGISLYHTGTRHFAH